MKCGQENFEDSENAVVSNKENEDVSVEIDMKNDETSIKTVKSILDGLRLTKRRKNMRKKPLTQKDENPMSEHDENPLPQNDDNKKDLDQNQAEPEADNPESQNVKTDDKATASKKSNKHKRNAAKRKAQKKKKKAELAAAQSTADIVPNLVRSVAVFDSKVYQEASTSYTRHNHGSYHPGNQLECLHPNFYDTIRDLMLKSKKRLRLTLLFAYTEHRGVPIRE